MAKFCPNCGSPLSEGTKFCPSCGTPAPQPAPQPQTYQQPQPTYQQPQPTYQQPAYQQPQPTYQQPAYQQPMQAPTPAKKKGKDGRIAVVALVLVAAIVASIFLLPFGKKNPDIICVEVLFPKATPEEGVMNLAASASINAYLAARASLDMLAAYEDNGIDADNAKEFSTLLENTLQLFEDAEKYAAFTDEAAQQYINTAGSSRPTYTVVAETSSGGLMLSASAAEDSAAVRWAKDITTTFDSAPSGNRLRTLAEQLGTDAQHARLQLVQAQNILSGAAYSDFESTANNYYQAAKVAKTTGTAAGFVIAVAAAPAAATIGTAVKAGCVVCSGINTALEIGETASVIRAGGEDTDFSQACAKTEAQMAPVTTIFNIAKVGLAAKDMAKLGETVVKQGYNALSDAEKAALGTKTFVGLSFGAGQIGNYANSGKILGGSFTETKDGLKFTLRETLVGTDAKSIKNVEEVLKETGVGKETKDAAVTALEEAKKTEEATGVSEIGIPLPVETPAPDDRIPPEIGKQLIRANQETTPDDFDIDRYLDSLREVLYELYAREETTAAETEAPLPAVETTAAAAPADDGKLSLSKVVGTYTISGSETWIDFEDNDDSYTDSATIGIKFRDDGNGNIIMDSPETEMSYGPVHYDAEIGTCSFEDEDGLVLYVTFTASGGGISVKLGYDQAFENGHGYGSYTGTKH
ncbi:MAG: zinc ribbon domain-containing protein [Clostridia bacterium]|nr:zinc ribbon domain-containing protein [Clostridia bacterium]